MIRSIPTIFSICLLFTPVESFGLDDRIIVIVNDKVILKSEIQNAIDNLSDDEITKDFSTLSEREIISKIIDRMIDKNLLLQAAKRFDIEISDIALENKLIEIATSQGLSLNEMRNQILSNGDDYQRYVQELKDQMTIDALFMTQFYSRANVTEEEVDSFMRREKIYEQGNIKYELIEFVIIDDEKKISKDLINQLYIEASKTSFIEVKEKYRNYEINVRNIGEIEMTSLPTLYIDALRDKNNGDYTDLIESSKGYHILKVLSAKNKEVAYIDEYKVRHILIKPDPMTSEKDIKEKLFEIRNEITSIEVFAQKAKEHSSDLASAFNGGDLNWQRTKNLVPEFAVVMEKTPIGTVSDPFPTKFGWHILYVENKRTINDAKSIIRGNVANAIRADKAKREREDWKASLKDQAFIEIKDF